MKRSAALPFQTEDSMECEAIEILSNMSNNTLPVAYSDDDFKKAIDDAFSRFIKQYELRNASSTCFWQKLNGDDNLKHVVLISPPPWCSEPVEFGRSLKQYLLDRSKLNGDRSNKNIVVKISSDRTCEYLYNTFFHADGRPLAPVIPETASLGTVGICSSTLGNCLKRFSMEQSENEEISQSDSGFSI